MPTTATLDWRGDEIKKRLRAGLVKAITRAAIVVQGAMKEQLNQAGGGRYYARNKRARQLAGSSRFGELIKKQVDQLMLETQVRKERKMWNKGVQGPVKVSLREAGIHQASAPGESPAPDFGLLRDSVQVNLSKAESNLQVGVGTNLMVGDGYNLGTILELGTRRIKKRPWVRPAIARAIPAMKESITVKTVLGGD